MPPRVASPKRNKTPTLFRNCPTPRVRKFRTTLRLAQAARCRVSAANSFRAPLRTRKPCSSALASLASKQGREAATQVQAHLRVQQEAAEVPALGAPVLALRVVPVWPFLVSVPRLALLSSVQPVGL